MSGKNSKQYKNKSSTNSASNKLYLLPLIFIAAIVPFIMHSYQFDTGLGSYSWFTEDGTRVDIFLFYKQVFLLIAVSIMLLVTIYAIYSKTVKANIIAVFIPIIIYGLLSLLSTIFSDNPMFGIKGVYEQFESIFVLLSYCFIVYYAFLFVKSEADLTFLLRYLLIGVLVMCALGILQTAGFDPITTDAGKRLYLSKIYWDYLDKFTMTFEKHRVYLTLYNPNYVGSYVSLTLPLFLGLAVTEKAIRTKLLYILAVIGLTISLYASQSDTGIISIVAALIIGVFFFRKYIFKNLKIAIPVLSCGLIFIIAFSAMNFSTIKNKIDGVFHLQKSNYNITDIKTDENLTITYKGNDLKISMGIDSGNVLITLTDANFNEVSATITADNSYLIEDERFAGIQISPVMYQNILCIDAKIDGKDWMFTNQMSDNTFYYLNSVGKFDKMVTADSAIFNGYEVLASGRGYIWSRSIPLLKDNVLLGSGADTFVTVYPQRDYLWSINAGFSGEILTRPHSLYLQDTVFQSGVLALNCIPTFQHSLLD